MIVYVATSWRNTWQPEVVSRLRGDGHDVYDFRNPVPGDSGFSWSEIDPNWKEWSPEQYREALNHPIARRGYGNDIRALRACDACVLILPSGRSASWELGYAMGQGKRCFVLLPWMGSFQAEPELMYQEAEIATTLDQLVDLLRVTWTLGPFPSAKLP